MPTLFIKVEPSIAYTQVGYGMAPSSRYVNLSKHYKDYLETEFFVEKSSASFKIPFFPLLVALDIPNSTVAQHIVHGESSRYKGMHRVTLALLHKAILPKPPPC